MIAHNCQVQVRFAETDQMGIVYHANYFVWFEIGRTSLLKSIGLPYRKLEQSGARLPVIKAHCEYFKPAKYDDLLTIHTKIESAPRATIEINYKITNELDEVLVRGYTQHTFMNNDGKPRRPPQEFKEKMALFFS